VGLVPAWWKPGTGPKSGKARTMPMPHDARSDRWATAPSWQGPFAKRRAVIPAAGYYEWQPTEDADGNPWVTINEAAETGTIQWCAVIEPHTSSRGVTRHRSALRPRRTTPSEGPRTRC
jgi:putative SOS response-associated peptidase YedK